MPPVCTLTYFEANFLPQFRADFHPFMKAFDEFCPALTAHRLGCLHRRVGERWIGGEPEADEQRERLVGEIDVPCKPIELARDAIEAPAHRSLKPIAAIGGQKGCQRRFDDRGARYMPGGSGGIEPADVKSFEAAGLDVVVA